MQEPARGSPRAARMAAGPEFLVPFAQREPARPTAVPAQVEMVEPEEPVEARFMEASDDVRQMEAELARGVLVTVTGNRPMVDLASAAEALHAEFDIGPMDMSIRPFFLDDFLVLCQDGAVRDRMVRAGHTRSSWFELNLRPWNRQAQATAALLPFLVPIALRGVPAHTWSQRTASVILRGLGYVVGVDESTARRLDMADFRVWLRTDRPRRIPRCRLLFIDEPRRNVWAEGIGHRVAAGRRTKTLWYPIDITVLAEPVLVDDGDGDGRRLRLLRRHRRHPPATMRMYRVLASIGPGGARLLAVLRPARWVHPRRWRHRRRGVRFKLLSIRSSLWSTTAVLARSLGCVHNRLLGTRLMWSATSQLGLGPRRLWVLLLISLSPLPRSSCRDG